MAAIKGPPASAKHGIWKTGRKLKTVPRRDMPGFLGPSACHHHKSGARLQKRHTFCEVNRGDGLLGIQKSRSFAVMSAFLAFADILPTPMDIALLMAGVLGMIAGLKKK